MWKALDRLIMFSAAYDVRGYVMLHDELAPKYGPSSRAHDQCLSDDEIRDLRDHLTKMLEELP